MTKPTRNQKIQRDAIINFVWDNFKSQLSMKDLAFIFSLHIDTIYQILRGGRDEKKIIMGEAYKMNRRIDKMLEEGKEENYLNKK